MSYKNSYKIKHDYLFENEDTKIAIPLLDKTTEKFSTLSISKILKASKESEFVKAIKGKSSNIVLLDDIGQCLNPQSESYKLFIIRCIYRKLSKLGFNIFI